MKGFEIISVMRIASIMQALRDVRTLPAQLKFLNRTRVLDATDGEILGYYDGNIIMADILADDQAATVTQTGKLTLETDSIPNLKKGHLIKQEMLNTLMRIAQGAPAAGDVDVFTNFMRGRLDDTLLGIRQRMETMIIGMWRDELSYDNNGIKFKNVSWGMPSDLKPTVAVLWTDAANATPIADIQNFVQYVKEKYGVEYDRITLTTTALNLIFATTEFRNKASLYSQLVLPTAASFPTSDNAMMNGILGRILGVEIETYDTQFTIEDNAGKVSQVRALPTNEVLYSVKANDNNPNVTTWGNGVVTESIVGNMPGVQVVGAGGFGGAQYGPVGYATVKGDLNPPNATLWGVCRGFPRKKLRTATAVMKVAA